MQDYLVVGSIAFIFIAGIVFFAYSKTQEQERHDMVKYQIQARGIKNEKVLEAMKKVERHKFVPEEMQRYAYRDSALPIGEDQTISQPYIVALMSSVLEPKEEDIVLEIGTGSGYQAAVLGEIVKKVYTIEIVEKLGKRSKKLLKDLGYKNIEVKIGDGYKGWSEHAPFDKIIVTAAPGKIPQPLLEQLKPGGLMVIPVGESRQELQLIKKTKDGKIIKQDLIPVRFVPMTGEVEKIK